MNDDNPMFNVGGMAVQFTSQPIEDRDASLSAGHTIYRDQHMATIHLPGGNERRVYQVDRDWLKRQHPDMSKAYEAWRDNQQFEGDGTPITMAPFLTPAQIATCRSARLMTIEALAEAADSVIERMGMGAVAMRRHAQSYLKAAEGPGAAAGEIERRDAQIASLEDTVSDLRKQLGEMNAALQAMRQRHDPSQGAMMPAAGTMTDVAVDSGPLLPRDEPPAPKRQKARKAEEPVEDDATATAIDAAVQRARSKPRKR